MKYVLILGAGFSRNWGGWLASEVNGHLPTSPGIRSDPHVVDVLAGPRPARPREAVV
jgi:hypothetical protein